jgi:polysaccharide biosynthesis protein PslH
MHILWIKTELLHPVDKGGKIRTYQTLKHLKAVHDVTYVTLDDGSAAPEADALAEEYCHDLIRIPFAAPAKGTGAFYADLARNVFSGLPYAVSRYRSPALRDAIRSLVRERRVELVVCDFLTPSINVPHDLGVPTLLFQHNVEAAIWERHATVATHPVTRAYMREQWRRMREFEGRECRRFDHVVAVSDADRDTFARDYGVASVSSVPTGVDVDFFRPSGESGAAPARAREIVFTGSMDWMPNEDGLGWFTADILPRIRARIPDATLAIVGRNPTARIRALAALPGVEVTGTVPDIRPFLERCAVVIVPLRVGGGTRLKIYEAMAMEKAIVSTTIGAEGLPVTDAADIRIADDAASFADAVVQLLANPGDATRLGRAAAAMVRERFGWTQAAARFAEVCEATRHAARSPLDAGRAA